MAYEQYVNEAADATGLDPSLIQAVIAQESSGNPDAVSDAGAEGLMQLMPGTASDMGVTDPFDPEQNIMGGARYLAQQIADSDGNVRIGLAKYNGGPGNVGDETLAYADQVLGRIGGGGARMIPGMGDNDIIALAQRYGRLENPDEPLNTNLIDEIMGQSQESPQQNMYNAYVQSALNGAQIEGQNEGTYQSILPILNNMAKLSVDAAGQDATLDNAAQNKTDVGLLADAISNSANSSNKGIYAGIAKALAGVQLPTSDPNQINASQLVGMANQRQIAATAVQAKMAEMQQQYENEKNLLGYKAQLAKQTIPKGFLPGIAGSGVQVIPEAISQDPDKVDSDAEKVDDAFDNYFNKGDFTSAENTYNKSIQNAELHGNYDLAQKIASTTGGSLAIWKVARDNNDYTSTPDQIQQKYPDQVAQAYSDLVSAVNSVADYARQNSSGVRTNTGAANPDNS